MNVVSDLENPDFEKWVIETYPDLFSEWELEVSEYLDLDEWLEMEHFGVIAAWDRLKGRKINYPAFRHSA